MPDKSPIIPFLEKQGVLLLDGGLATELENMGYDLNHPLWSARLLDKQPEAIRAVHRAYLEAGADCIVAAGYQASIPGFMAAGMSREKAKSMLKLTVDLACEAREEYVAAHGNQITLKPLVAAGIGPYGAYLADGSEYHGKDGLHISDGTPLAECAALLKDCPQIVAIGVNCTPPKYITYLIEEIRKVAPARPVVVYPNSGETYDAASRSWTGETDPLDFGKAACDWKQRGAGLIGGCCRTGPDHIRAIRKKLVW